MPRKVRELIEDLEKAGFVNIGGKEVIAIFAISPGPKQRFPEKLVTMRDITKNAK